MHHLARIPFAGHSEPLQALAALGNMLQEFMEPTCNEVNLEMFVYPKVHPRFQERILIRNDMIPD